MATCRHPDNPCRAPRASALWVALTLVSVAHSADARGVQLETVTTAQATHWARSDGGVASWRLFRQGLTLRAMDLLDDGRGSLNATLTLRYEADLGIPDALRERAPFTAQFNALMIEQAWVDWRPHRAARLRLGRQWAWGPLGARDLDGAVLSWSPQLADGLRAHVELHLGRDVQALDDLLGSDDLDVQGLPLRDEGYGRALDGLLGARAGLRWGHHLSFDVQAQRRWSFDAALTPGDATRQTLVGESRVGAALSASVSRAVNVTGAAIFDMLQQRLTLGQARLAARLPWEEHAVSVGVERRRPWFDASSIFNIFDPAPQDSFSLAYQLPIAPWRTHLEARVWYRVYHGDLETQEQLGQAHPDDATALGAALMHHTRLWGAAHWSSTLSALQAPSDYGGQQWLLDTRVRVPALTSGLFINARAVGAHLRSASPRGGEARVASGLLGVDYPVLRVGRISVSVEQRVGDRAPRATNLYASLSLEAWP